MRYLPVILLVVLFIYGLIDCLRSDRADVRSIPKPAWILVIVLLPLIGVLLWFFLGRPQYATTPGSPSNNGTPASGRPASRSSRMVAPDDDPAFLRKLDTSRRQKAEDDRLRRLKAELDAREAKLREDHPNDEPKV